MLSPRMVDRAVKVAAECIEIILKPIPKNGKYGSRNPEEIALIGEIIQNAITATQPQNIFEAMRAINTPKAQGIEGGTEHEASSD